MNEKNDLKPMVAYFDADNNALIIEIGLPGYNKDLLELEQIDNERVLLLTCKSASDNKVSLCASSFVIKIGPLSKLLDMNNMVVSCINGLFKIQLPRKENTGCEQYSPKYDPFLAKPGVN